jgi:hypothetical protein
MKHLFFRDDDLGWEHDRFRRMLESFVAHGFKLNAAAIPAACRAMMSQRTGLDAVVDGWGSWPLVLEVHAHGWSHANHEPAGKKAEFGAGRPGWEVARELVEAQAVCRDLFGPAYYPAFVPPWNRIADEWLPLVREAGFELLSRDGERRATVPGLAEWNVSLDLHTDKARPEAGPAEWLAAVERWPADVPLGVMLHHARMGERDHARLREFLAELRQRGIQTWFFSELGSGMWTGGPEGLGRGPA